MTHNLRINGQRLWETLMEIGEIGATDRGGSHRLTLSDEDKQARDRFVEWVEATGCTVAVDRLGNIFARRPGKDDSRHPVAIGSHLDTQPFGGKFDGVFGVLAGLEIVRTLNDNNIETEAPLEIVNWTNEEGARFAPSMIASGVFGGEFDLEYALNLTDIDGIRFGDELARIGYDGSLPVGDHPFAAFFEAHIEQGPVLEQEGKTIGVVTGAQGFRWYDLILRGQAAHTGSTPMVGRRNALLGMAHIVAAVNQIALDHAPDGRGTVGSQVQVAPGSRNIIPGRVDFTVDLRHPDADRLAGMDDALRTESRRIADEIGLDLTLEQISHTPPVVFDEGCVMAVQNACESLGYSYRRITSGAGHDACYVTRVAPASMVFVPCAGGISHSEDESAEPEDLAAGCNVLLHAALSFVDIAGS